MASKERQMTLEEIQAQHQDVVGSDWRVTVRLIENGHVQIRSTRKTA
jgi:hypothetical protein